MLNIRSQSDLLHVSDIAAFRALCAIYASTWCTYKLRRTHSLPRFRSVRVVSWLLLPVLVASPSTMFLFEQMAAPAQQSYRSTTPRLAFYAVS
jgi:hypothetical protein